MHYLFFLSKQLRAEDFSKDVIGSSAGPIFNQVSYFPLLWLIFFFLFGSSEGANTKDKVEGVWLHHFEK